MSHTHTYATLEVSAAAYDEIAAKLKEAGYDDAFDDEEKVIDMHGIGLVRLYPPAYPSPAVVVAFEAGYKACERGENIQKALEIFKR